MVLLRDVLGFRASEAARILDVSEESVTSALKRARAALGRHRPSAQPHTRHADAARRRFRPPTYRWLTRNAAAIARRTVLLPSHRSIGCSSVISVVISPA